MTAINKLFIDGIHHCFRLSIPAGFYYIYVRQQKNFVLSCRFSVISQWHWHQGTVSKTTRM